MRVPTLPTNLLLALPLAAPSASALPQAGPRRPPGRLPAAAFEEVESRAGLLLREHGLTPALARGRGVVVVGPEGVAAEAELEGLGALAAALDRGLEEFAALLEAPPLPTLLGGAPAEFYVFGRDRSPYVATVAPIVAWTDTAPPGYAEAAERLHGFQYWWPRCVSSVRLGGRPAEDLTGHCLHHWGHQLLHRHRANGRLLPPWYDEAFAALFERRVSGRNAVFCVAATARGQGTSAGSTLEARLDRDALRAGDWQRALRAALADPAAAGLDFDRLARKGYAELTALDVALGMGVVAWLVDGGDGGGGEGGGALERFHRALCASAPAPPRRVLEPARERQARYDAAFGAARGMDWRTADRAWRAWVLSGKR